jgi:branched-chain amino acid transport system substrate-binding protein
MKLNKFTRALLMPVAVAAAALAVAACGSSSNTTSTTSSTSSTSSTPAASSGTGSTTTASGTPYMLGSITSETGPFASSDAAGAPAIQAWASYVNAHGGINGHPVQVTVKDDQGNPSIALSEVKAFAAQSDILALVGSISSEEGSWGPVASALKLPVVGDFPFTPVSYSEPYVFPQGTTFPSLLYGQVYAAVKLEKTPKVGLYYCAEESACAGSVPPVKEFATQLGGTVVNAQAVSATAPNYDAICQSAKSAGVQTMILALGESTIVSVANSCASVDYHPNFDFQSTSLEPSQGSIPSLNNHSIGVTETFPWVASATPAQQAFQAGTTSVPAKDVGAAESLAWTSGALFQAAIANDHTTASRQSIAQSLWALPKGDTLGGLAPPLAYKANSPSPQVKCFFAMKLTGGKWVPVGGGSKTYCQP